MRLFILNIALSKEFSPEATNSTTKAVRFHNNLIGQMTCHYIPYPTNLEGYSSRLDFLKDLHM